MYRCVMVAAVAAAVALGVADARAEVIFNWATVGNAGNSADPVTGFGSVANEYRIATTEVTNAQYAEFLNAVDPGGTNPNGLYNPQMAGNYGGIEFQSGADGENRGNGSYVVQDGRGNEPVTYVSFLDSMRFVNWLENGQGAGGTENGVYNVADGLSETRAADAQFFLPTENEWYKAAYHQPAAQGGDSDDYWLYPTASNTLAANESLAGANYNDGDFVGTGTSAIPSTVSPFTEVGSYTDAASFYGTFDQGGNVDEWNETLRDSTRGTRGGSWFREGIFLKSENAGSIDPSSEGAFLGFRVASSVPEPGMLALLVLGAATLLSRRRD